MWVFAVGAHFMIEREWRGDEEGLSVLHAHAHVCGVRLRVLLWGAATRGYGVVCTVYQQARQVVRVDALCTRGCVDVIVECAA